MRAGFPPVIIRRADRFSFHSNTYSITPGNYNFNREVYYKHLQTANEGDIRPFIRLNLFHFPKPIQHDSYVQVHSVVYGENVGGVPVGQPGVHHGGGGGRVHQPSPKPCRGFHRGSWHCCEKVRLPQIVICYPPPVMIFHQVQAEPGKALVKPGGGGRWGWRRSYQVKCKTCGMNKKYESKGVSQYWSNSWPRLSDGRREEIVLTMDEEDIITSWYGRLDKALNKTKSVIFDMTLLDLWLPLYGDPNDNIVGGWMCTKINMLKMRGLVQKGIPLVSSGRY